MNQGYDELRAIYRAAAHCEGPTAGDRRAVRAALMGAATATVTLGAQAANSGTTLVASAVSGTQGFAQALLAGKFLGGLLVGAACGTALCVAAYVVVPANVAGPGAHLARTRSGRSVGEESDAARRESTRARSESNPGVTPAARPGDAESQREALAPSAAERASTPTPLEAPTGAQHPTSGRAEPSPRSEKAASAEELLLRETAALAEVQAALNAKDPERALWLLREQNASFVGGQLGEERAAAMVLALCAAGSTTEAEQARARFLASHPNSPLSKRVRASCGR